MSSKEKILKAALKLFMQKGYEKTSMNDIVKESNYTKGGIYHHFKNKHELFIETIKLLFNEFHTWEEEFFKNCKSLKDFFFTYFDSMHRLKEFLSQISEYDGAEEYEFFLLMVEAITKFPEIKELHNQEHAATMTQLMSTLDEAQKAGKIRKDISSYTISIMVHALGEGTMLYHILNEKVDLKNIGNQYAEIVWNTIKKG
jgi:AcrR family transcriptional regulator